MTNKIDLCLQGTKDAEECYILRCLTERLTFDFSEFTARVNYLFSVVLLLRTSCNLHIIYARNELKSAL